MTRDPALGPRKWLRWTSGLLLIAAGCAGPPVPVAAPPVPAGQARVWFYRPYEPSESLNLALIDMNGSYIGAVENGSAFYRDVSPGHYHIAPQSFGRDFNQDKDVDLVPGQQLYVKIVSLQSWAVSVSASRTFQRDMFYAWLIPTEVAQLEIARDRSGI
jgi:uncharacterized protein DUF2846